MIAVTEAAPMDMQTVMQALLSIVILVMSGIVTYLFRKVDSIPTRAEFNMTVKHLEAEIGHNTAVLSELKESNASLSAGFDKRFDKIDEKLDRISRG